MYSKETGMQVTEFTSSVAGLARLCMPAGKMLSIARDRWLFDHMSVLLAYAFYTMCSGRFPRGLWKLARIEVSPKYIKEPKYTET